MQTDYNPTDVEVEEKFLTLTVRVWHNGGLEFESAEVREEIEAVLRDEMREEFNVNLANQPCMVEIMDVELVD